MEVNNEIKPQGFFKYNNKDNLHVKVKQRTKTTHLIIFQDVINEFFFFFFFEKIINELYILINSINNAQVSVT